jgi:hypothetical protein
MLDLLTDVAAVAILIYILFHSLPIEFTTELCPQPFWAEMNSKENREPLSTLLVS